MRRRNFWLDLIVIGVVPMLAIFSVGCPKENYRQHRRSEFAAGDYDPEFPHNLARVRCRQDTDGKPVIVELVATKQVLYEPLDRVIFVCRGDTVEWRAKTPGLKFTVTFKDQTLVKDLFESGGGKFKYDATSAPPPPAEQPKQKVKSLIQDGLVDYSYSVQVCCNAVGTPFDIDPHVIPMGK